MTSQIYTFRVRPMTECPGRCAPGGWRMINLGGDKSVGQFSVQCHGVSLSVTRRGSSEFNKQNRKEYQPTLMDQDFSLFSPTSCWVSIQLQITNFGDLFGLSFCL